MWEFEGKNVTVEYSWNKGKGSQGLKPTYIAVLFLSLIISSPQILSLYRFGTNNLVSTNFVHVLFLLIVVTKMVERQNQWRWRPKYQQHNLRMWEILSEKMKD